MAPASPPHRSSPSTSGPDFTGTDEVYDVVFDVIGKSPFSRTMNCLKEHGRYLIANPSVSHMIRGVWNLPTCIRKIIFRLAGYTEDHLVTLKEFTEAGELRTVTDRYYPLDRIPEAYNCYVDDKRHKGNVVLTIDLPAPI